MVIRYSLFVNRYS